MPERSSEFVHIWYDVSTAVGLAFDSIRAHKLRSFLTLLGVIIGVASVVLVGAAIEGLGVYAEESTAKAFGSDTYLVAQIASVGRLTRKEVAEKFRRNKQLKPADERYLRDVNGDTTLYSAYRQRVADVKRENLTAEDTSIQGVAAAMIDIRDITVVDGRFFTDQEERSRAYVAVIGDEVKTMLFPSGKTPVGETLKLNGIDFLVVGVQERLGSTFGRSQDRNLYIPETTFARMFGTGQSISIFGRPKKDSGLTLEESLDETRAALRARFHRGPAQPDNFDTLTPDAIRSFIDQILGLIAAIVVPVTCISLVVGGIVIMNIMLVSVTERTREIGIRKSLGARRFDIQLQVLIEAVILSIAGGAIGLGIGVGFTALLTKLFEVKLEVTMPYVVLSLAVSSLVGVISGWYPAARASKLDPVVALRAE